MSRNDGQDIGNEEFILEIGIGKDRLDNAFADVGEAISVAEQVWASQGKAVQRDFLKASGAYFRVTFPDGDVIYDCVENARRADQRKSDATRAKKEPGYLREWADGLTSRPGISNTYECGALFEEGWDGTESVLDIIGGTSASFEEANDMLDYLAMLAVQRELEGGQ